MELKLATLTALERVAGLARRLGLGSLVDRLAPLVSRPFEHFELDVDGVVLCGTDLAQLHYVRELREYGRERTFVGLLTEAIPIGGVVLEGGPHLGFVTVHAARAVGPEGRVLVFEPNAAVHGILLENLHANAVEDRVELIPKALGDTAGRAPFFVSADTSNLFESVAQGKTVEVEIVRADEEVDGPVDVVKLDVEGAEPAALRGMQGLLTSDRPPGSLFLECHPELLARAGSSRDELLAILRSYGYTVEWIDEQSERTMPLSVPWTESYVNLCCRRAS